MAHIVINSALNPSSCAIELWPTYQYPIIMQQHPDRKCKLMHSVQEPIVSPCKSKTAALKLMKPQICLKPNGTGKQEVHSVYMY